MDSKLRKITILSCLAFIVLVAALVICQNRIKMAEGNNPIQTGKVSESIQQENREIQPGQLTGQIGDDLSAFMKDNTFFDQEKNPILEAAERASASPKTAGKFHAFHQHTHGFAESAHCRRRNDRTICRQPVQPVIHCRFYCRKQASRSSGNCHFFLRFCHDYLCRTKSWSQKNGSHPPRCTLRSSGSGPHFPGDFHSHASVRKMDSQRICIRNTKNI